MPYAQPGEAICARLLTALSATDVRERVYPEVPSPNESLPYVVYELIDGGDGVVLGGRSKTQEYLFRIMVFANDANSAASIMTAIHHQDNGLPGWSDRTNGVRGVFPRSSSTSGKTEDENVRFQERNYSIWFSG